MPPERWQDKYAAGENVPLTPQPAVAERYEVSPDGLTYTFHLRKDAQWSSGEPVIADDFFWSWRRTLHPETLGKYVYQLYYLKGAQEYNTAQVEVGTNVEVELPTRRDPL